MKQEFEEWLSTQPNNTDRTLAWKTWQAARKSIKINLPKIRKLEYNSNTNPYTNEVYLMEDDFYEVQELEDALDKAGVRY